MELIFHLIILAWATIFADSKEDTLGEGVGLCMYTGSDGFHLQALTNEGKFN